MSRLVPPRHYFLALMLALLGYCGFVWADDWCTEPVTTPGQTQQGDEGNFGVYQCFTDEGWVETAQLNVQKLSPDQYLEWWAYKKADGSNGPGFAHLADGDSANMDLRFQYLGEDKTDLKDFTARLPWQWADSYEVFQCISMKVGTERANCEEPSANEEEELCVSPSAEWGTGQFNIFECAGEEAGWQYVGRVNIQEVAKDTSYKFWWAYKIDPTATKLTSKTPILTSDHYFVRPGFTQQQTTIRFERTADAETTLDNFRRSLPWDADLFECFLTKILESP